MFLLRITHNHTVTWMTCTLLCSFQLRVSPGQIHRILVNRILVPIFGVHSLNMSRFQSKKIQRVAIIYTWKKMWVWKKGSKGAKKKEQGVKISISVFPEAPMKPIFHPFQVHGFHGRGCGLGQARCAGGRGGRRGTGAAWWRKKPQNGSKWWLQLGNFLPVWYHAVHYFKNLCVVKFDDSHSCYDIKSLSYN